MGCCVSCPQNCCIWCGRWRPGVAVLYFGSALGLLGCTAASMGQTMAVEGPNVDAGMTWPYGPGPKCQLNQCGGIFGVLFAIYALAQCLVTWVAASRAGGSACGKSTSTVHQPKVNVMVCTAFALNVLALLALGINFEASSNFNDIPGGTFFPTPSPKPPPKPTPTPTGPTPGPYDPNAHLKVSCQALSDFDEWRGSLPCSPERERDDCGVNDDPLCACRYGYPPTWTGMLICQSTMLGINFFWIVAIWCSACKADRGEAGPQGPQPSAPSLLAPTAEIPMARMVNHAAGAGGDGKAGPDDQQKLSGRVASKDGAALVEWLHSTGKGAYAQHFINAGIDGSILCDPTTTAPLLIEAVPGLPLIIATAILRQAAAEA